MSITYWRLTRTSATIALAGAILFGAPAAAWGADVDDDSVGIQVEISPLPTSATSSPTPTPQATSSSGRPSSGRLPTTGVDLWPGATIAVGLLGAGSTIVVRNRRKRRNRALAVG